MRRLSNHMWLVGLSAVVLVLMIGAVAWAGTGDDGGASTDPSGGSAQWVCPGGDGFRGRGGGWGMSQGTDPETFRQRMEERQGLMQERRDDLLGRLRGEMTPEDQATLDELMTKVDQQREALDQARADLLETRGQIRDLIGTYLPGGPGAPGDPGGMGFRGPATGEGTSTSSM